MGLASSPASKKSSQCWSRGFKRSDPGPAVLSQDSCQGTLSANTGDSGLSAPDRGVQAMSRSRPHACQGPRAWPASPQPAPQERRWGGGGRGPFSCEEPKTQAPRWEGLRPRPCPTVPPPSQIHNSWPRPECPQQGATVLPPQPLIRHLTLPPAPAGPTADATTPPVLCGSACRGANPRPQHPGDTG